MLFSRVIISVPEVNVVPSAVSSNRKVLPFARRVLCDDVESIGLSCNGSELPVTEETVVQQARSSEVLRVIAVELLVHEQGVSVSLSEGLDHGAAGNLDGLLFRVGLNSPVLLLVLVPIEVDVSHNFSSGHEGSGAIRGLSNGSESVSSGLSGDGLDEPVLVAIAVISEPVVDVEGAVVRVGEVRSLAA